MNRAALALLFVTLTGCVNPLTRAQMAEENEKERDLGVTVVADVADVANVGPIKIDGVALVTGLAGTGHTPPGYYRNLLEQYLLKHSGPRGGEIANDAHKTKVRQILDDPNNSLVIVTGYLPPGARKGDRFDVEVALPHGSKATSLAGGYLEVCVLRVYEAKANLSERHASSSEMLQGHVYGMAKGPLVVGFGANRDVHEQKAARVWQGGISRIDRPYSFLMKNDEKSVKISNAVAERLNYMYQDDPHSKARLSDEQKRILLTGDVMNQLNHKHDPTGLSQHEMAKAATKEMINVRVPFAYRFNHDRFLLVASKTPLRDNDPGIARYKERLKKMLLDPRDTIRAAIRLEAMGRESIPLLKAGLDSEHPFVRFAAAESLAYLGSTLGVDMLAKLAQDHAILASHCTLALASLGENVCRHRLGDLLASDEPALRCAAFHAFSQLDEADARLGGVHVNDTFWLYRQPSASTAMVYYSTSKRPQVVLYGRNITLARDTQLIVGKDFPVTVDKEGKCTVKCINTLGTQSKTCTSRLDDVLMTLADLGATYPDIVDFLRRAGDYQAVSCPIGSWTAPTDSLETLLKAGQNLK